ncbi:MAG: Unknown protein [uncultured Thiotrichaceae bacterium]|uniref:SPOR domain-containing protein n=1 Tax=uncultured Thiotrichaceae bacterium TaxID=298394 RepID=A0A6S6TN58_9GAMM|nr:MAG: Unknown protein [uncultured Thiotrichaceae bacterium]
MDNKSTTKRMIGAVVLVLIAALLLAWLLKGKNQSVQQQQELIADQTNQGSTPILGFPGVKEGEEAAQEGEGDAPYVIGDADTAAQQGGEAAQTTDDGNTEGATVPGAGVVAGAATAGKEAVQSLASNFQVRDSDAQRQVVDDGKAKAGTGSMGSSELALPKQGETDTAAAGDGDATQQAQTAQTQTADTTKAEPAPVAQTQQAQAAGSGSAAQDKQPVEQKKPVANVKLVGEKAVPAPRSQSSRVASSSSGSNTASASSSSRASRPPATQTATGGRGYAIQVLAASSRNKAEQVRQSIAVDGYPVFVVRANVNGKTVYRVRVGTYPARNAARSVQTKMKARYTKNQYVQNSFVTKN